MGRESRPCGTTRVAIPRADGSASCAIRPRPRGVNGWTRDVGSQGAETRLLTSELRDLLHRPVTLIVFGVVAVLVGFTHLLAGAAAARLPDGHGSEFAALLVFPEAYRTVLALLAMLGGMVAAAYAGAIGGAASASGTPPRPAVRGEDQPGCSLVQLGLLRFGAITIILLIGLLLAFGWGVLMALAGASIAGLPTEGVLDPSALGELPALVVRAWWSIVTLAAIGYAAGVVTRSRMAGLGIAAGLPLGEQVASHLVPPEVLRFAPVGSTSLLTGATTTDDALLALAVATMYVVGSLAVATAVVDRREFG